jgi:hypothetical protein
MNRSGYLGRQISKRKTMAATIRHLLLLTVIAMTVFCGNGYGDYQLVWSDEFDQGSLNTSNWSYVTGDGCPNLCGWGNNELEYYRPENVSVSGGYLIITSKQETYGGRSYTSGKIQSRYKRDFLYGKIEARMKIPTGGGMWPAFWMMPTDEVYGGWAASGEVAEDKVTVSYPNEIFLDRYNRHPVSGAGTQERAWQDKMISHELIAPYLPGFNDMGLRTTSAPFTNQENNFLLKGVWRCPLAKTRDIGLTMGQLRGSSRSYFRLDYSYLGRADLWADTMFSPISDRGSLTGKYPTSGQIMLTDTIFYWPNSDPDKIYWYNHGKQGSSSEGATESSSTYLNPTFAPSVQNQEK